MPIRTNANTKVFERATRNRTSVAAALLEDIENRGTVSPRAKRDEIVDTIKLMMDEHKDDRWTPQDQADYDRLIAEVENIDREIRIDQRNLDAEAEAHFSGRDRQAIGSRSRNPRPIAAYVPGASAFDPRALFAKAPGVGPHPFEGIADLVASVVASARDGVVDPRLSTLKNAASTGGDATGGGFLVPRTVELQIWDGAFSESDILSLVDTRSLLPGLHAYPVFDGHDRSVGGQGAITTSWVAETGQFTAQKAVLREVELQPKKAGSLIAVSNELLADAAQFEQGLMDALIANARRELEERIVLGSGGTQPLGIMNSPSLITVTRSTRFPDLLSCYSKNFNRASAVWLIHSTVLPELFQLAYKPSTTDIGAGVFVQRADGVMTLLGRPVIVTDACAAAGTTGDVIFVDLQSYMLGIRAGLQIQASSHIYFDTDQSAIRSIMRADGTGKFSQQVKQRDGATLNSWAVTIS
jgi:HK97 family phage major capsid protein